MYDVGKEILLLDILVYSSIMCEFQKEIDALGEAHEILEGPF